MSLWPGTQRSISSAGGGIGINVNTSRPSSSSAALPPVVSPELSLPARTRISFQASQLVRPLITVAPNDVSPSLLPYARRDLLRSAARRITKARARGAVAASEADVAFEVVQWQLAARSAVSAARQAAEESVSELYRGRQAGMEEEVGGSPIAGRTSVQHVGTARGVSGREGGGEVEAGSHLEASGGGASSRHSSRQPSGLVTARHGGGGHMDVSASYTRRNGETESAESALPRSHSSPSFSAAAAAAASTSSSSPGSLHEAGGAGISKRGPLDEMSGGRGVSDWISSFSASLNPPQLKLAIKGVVGAGGGSAGTSASSSSASANGTAEGTDDSQFYAILARRHVNSIASRNESEVVRSLSSWKANVADARVATEAKIVAARRAQSASLVSSMDYGGSLRTPLFNAAASTAGAASARRIAAGATSIVAPDAHIASLLRHHSPVPAPGKQAAASSKPALLRVPVVIPPSSPRSESLWSPSKGFSPDYGAEPEAITTATIVLEKGNPYSWWKAQYDSISAEEKSEGALQSQQQQQQQQQKQQRPSTAPFESKKLLRAPPSESVKILLAAGGGVSFSPIAASGSSGAAAQQQPPSSPALLPLSAALDVAGAAAELKGSAAGIASLYLTKPMAPGGIPGGGARPPSAKNKAGAATKPAAAPAASAAGSTVATAGSQQAAQSERHPFTHSFAAGGNSGSGAAASGVVGGSNAAGLHSGSHGSEQQPLETASVLRVGLNILQAHLSRKSELENEMIAEHFQAIKEAVDDGGRGTRILKSCPPDLSRLPPVDIIQRALSFKAAVPTLLEASHLQAVGALPILKLQPTQSSGAPETAEAAKGGKDKGGGKAGAKLPPPTASVAAASAAPDFPGRGIGVLTGDLRPFSGAGGGCSSAYAYPANFMEQFKHLEAIRAQVMGGGKMPSEGGADSKKKKPKKPKK